MIVKISKKTVNYLIFTVGFISLILGIIGLFLPLLPTTPFILLASFSFLKSNKKYHNMIIKHKKFGPIIKKYQEKGAIDKKIKIKAITMIILGIGSSIYFFKMKTIINILLIIIGLSVSLFIVTRPNN